MSLSPYEANILDFCSLIRDNPQLLTEDDRNSLTKLVTTLPEDIEKISDALALWCDDHSRILEMFQVLPPHDPTVRGPGNRPTPMTPQKAKELLDNTVRPDSTHTKSKNTPPKNE